MPLSIQCPNCRAILEADVELGQVIRCPGCKKQFEIDEDALDTEKKADNKYIVPLGYAAFVGLPILITVIVVFSLSGGKRKPEPSDDPPVARNDHKPSSNTHVPKKTPKHGPQPRQNDRDKDPDPEETPDDPAAKLDPKTRPDAKTDPANPNPDKLSKPDKKDMTVTVVDVPQIELAPIPHDAGWKLPLAGYVSDWKKVGMVDVRIGGLAVSKVPLIDGKDRRVESEKPYLVAVMEVRKNDLKQKRTIFSWTYFNSYYSALFLSNDKAIANGYVPPGSKMVGKLDKQVLPDDGSLVQDFLLFAVPADDAGELNLRLDAERLGENGDVWFKIPALAWKKQ